MDNSSRNWISPLFSFLLISLSEEFLSDLFVNGNNSEFWFIVLTDSRKSFQYIFYLNAQSFAQLTFTNSISIDNNSFWEEFFAITFEEFLTGIFYKCSYSIS